MRSVFQLRTPQNGDGDQHSVDSVKVAVDLTIANPIVASPANVRFREPQIEMAHGAGGKASRRLVEGLFAPLLFASSSEPLGDAAHLDFNGTRLAITTDSFVVKPLSFPGGSIGELAVNGTVNDLAVSGAKAEAMVVTFVLEAGLPTPVLEAEVRAMGNAARKAGLVVGVGHTDATYEQARAAFARGAHHCIVLGPSFLVLGLSRVLGPWCKSTISNQQSAIRST